MLHTHPFWVASPCEYYMFYSSCPEEPLGWFCVFGIMCDTKMMMQVSLGYSYLISFGYIVSKGADDLYSSISTLSGISTLFSIVAGLI